MVRQSVRRAAICNQSARQITQTLKLDIVLRRDQQTLSETP